MHLAHILVATKWEAEKLRLQLEGGASFATLAVKHSLCTSSAQGGDLGVVRLERLNGDFAEEAEKLIVDQLSTVVKTVHGYHLIKRLP